MQYKYQNTSAAFREPALVATGGIEVAHPATCTDSEKLTRRMDGAVVRVTLALVVPGIVSVFGVAFLCAWLVDRNRTYLVLLAVACAAFALAATSVILAVPPDAGPNAVVSGFFYTAAVLAAAQGMLLRSERALPLIVIVAVLAASCLLLWYFYYIHRSLITRVYILNFGAGLILLTTALRLKHLSAGRLTDRVLFWTLLAFALQFFPRTLLTIGFSAPQGGREGFANSSFWQAFQLSLAVFGSGLCLAILAAAVADVIESLRSERDIDHLTGVLNRGGFEAAVSSSLRGHEPTTASLILCDVDHFKSINDNFGHAAGDAVLREVGALLRRNARKGDVIGRLGGEEFAVFLPHAALPDAFACGERMRLAIAQTVFTPLDRRWVTASFGVATTGQFSAWEELYTIADAQLYRAKRSGRNRTIAGDGPETTWSATATLETDLSQDNTTSEEIVRARPGGR